MSAEWSWGEEFRCREIVEEWQNIGNGGTRRENRLVLTITCT